MRANLVLGLFWLCLGVGLIAAHYAGYKRFGIDSDLTPLLGLVAVVLGAWKLVRWWANRVSAKTRNYRPAPPPKRRIEDRPNEYNPDLDFSRPEPPRE
jgi:hypothetical protein